MHKVIKIVTIVLLTLLVNCLESCKKTPNTITKPEVETSQVAYITDNSALCVGFVKSDGGSKVVERGVCWSVEHNPIASDNHVIGGEGLGEFSCNITHLESNTTYYLRAYARNSVGESYGNEIAFSTLNSNSNITLPIINLQAVEYITDSSAICSAEIIDNGGAEIIDCGICWSENHNPLIIDNHESDSSVEFGPFTCAIKNLNSGTTYYVRAYASNNQGISYSNEICFTTTPYHIPVPIGAINGLFSVSDDLQVFFSKGNLQYQASSNTWRFADNQWDYVGSTVVETGETGGTVIGSSNHLVSSTYSGWIDMFYWGTSGRDDYSPRANCYQPWSTDDHYVNYFAYGGKGWGLFSQSGKADWGYNAISNGGNTENQWRTMTKEEWEYVINTRNTSSGIRYAKAQVNNVNGLILLPDSWTDSVFVLHDYNLSEANYFANVISQIEWNTMESNGAVFLPAGGGRTGITVGSIGISGTYWSSSPTNTSGTGAGVMAFSDIRLYVSSGIRYGGRLVRLVSKN